MDLEEDENHWLLAQPSGYHLDQDFMDGLDPIEEDQGHPGPSPYTQALLQSGQHFLHENGSLGDIDNIVPPNPDSPSNRHPYDVQLLQHFVNDDMRLSSSPPIDQIMAEDSCAHSYYTMVICDKHNRMPQEEDSGAEISALDQEDLRLYEKYQKKIAEMDIAMSSSSEYDYARSTLMRNSHGDLSFLRENGDRQSSSLSENGDDGLDKGQGQSSFSADDSHGLPLLSKTEIQNWNSKVDIKQYNRNPYTSFACNLEDLNSEIEWKEHQWTGFLYEMIIASILPMLTYEESTIQYFLHTSAHYGINLERGTDLRDNQALDTFITIWRDTIKRRVYAWKGDPGSSNKTTLRYVLVFSLIYGFNLNNKEEDPAHQLLLYIDFPKDQSAGVHIGIIDNLSDTYYHRHPNFHEYVLERVENIFSAPIDQPLGTNFSAVAFSEPIVNQPLISPKQDVYKCFYLNNMYSVPDSFTCMSLSYRAAILLAFLHDIQYFLGIPGINSRSMDDMHGTDSDAELLREYEHGEKLYKVCMAHLQRMRKWILQNDGLKSGDFVMLPSSFVRRTSGLHPFCPILPAVQDSYESITINILPNNPASTDQDSQKYVYCFGATGDVFVTERRFLRRLHDQAKSCIVAQNMADLFYGIAK